MGGFGSGRWGWETTKHTVEESLALPISEMSKGLNQTAAGEVGKWSCGSSIQWSRWENQIGQIGFLMLQTPYGPVVHLSYTATPNNGESTECKYILLPTTSIPNFGGRRWWWQCPLNRLGMVSDSGRCNRRVSKLYLPPGAMYFGCRQCHDLTFTSCKDSHKLDNLYRDIAIGMRDRYPNRGTKTIKRLMSQMGKRYGR